MSKQSAAKVAQGYVAKALTCGQCKHVASTMMLPAWMAAENSARAEEGRAPKWSAKEYAIEKDVHCAIGGFCVKKSASCNLIESK